MFREVDFDVAATGAGDTSRVIISCVLPQNFSYVMCDTALSLRPISAGTNNYDNQVNVNVTDSDGGTDRTWSWRTVLASDGEVINNTLHWKYWRPLNLPTMTILTAPGQQASATLVAMNETANDVAYKGNLVVRFLAFDVNQVHHWAVNTPQLVR